MHPFLTAAQKRKKKAKIDWSNLEAQDGGADGEEEGSQAGGNDEEGLDEVDYDQEDEDFNDNDYENNYFDGGEDENDDDLGDGAVGRDGGGDGELSPNASLLLCAETDVITAFWNVDD